jgi:hypothetical protein
MALLMLTATSVALALGLPPILPGGIGWSYYWHKSTVPTWGCDKTVNVYRLKTNHCRDFTDQEREAEKQDFLSMHDGHVAYRGPATYTYNCHGYVFHGSRVWGGDPANWEGPEYPGYYGTSVGPVRLWPGNSHSALGGSAYAYRSKCGYSILCDHDHTLYGTHTKRWKQHSP